MRETLPTLIMVAGFGQLSVLIASALVPIRLTPISNRYTRGGYNNSDTRCNIFAGDVMRAMGVPLPTKSNKDPMTANANDLNAWLNSGDGRKNGWTMIDVNNSDDLQRLIEHVSSGRPALASFHQYPAGHIAVIRPEQSANLTGIGQLHIAQAGAHNYDYTTIQTGFGRTSGVQIFHS